MNQRPNILFVFSDQHRATAMGSYGNPHVATPHLDALAGEGARVQVAVANTPVCAPYRASLLSGCYAHTVGHVTNNLDFRPQGPTLAQCFRDAGYAAGYVGKWHLHFPGGDPAHNRAGYVPPEARHGFDDYWAGFNGSHQYYRWQYYLHDDPEPIQVEGYQPEVQVDQVLAGIEGFEAQGRPWLMMLSWGPPHTPFDPPPGYAERYAGVPLPPNVPPGRPQAYARDVLPRYYGLVTSLDDAFGRLLGGLEALGVADETIVVYTSDHGDMLGSHGYRGNKRWPHDASIRVPLLVRWPGRIPAGRVVQGPVGTPDLIPTLLDLAGLEIPDGLDGVSAAPAFLDGDESTLPPFAYCAMHYAYVPWPGWRALRSRQYLYARTRAAPWLLFDTAVDPWQEQNLVEAGDHDGLIGRLDRELQHLMEATGDSWELAVEGGDAHRWHAGTAKLKSCDLGVPWPGGPQTWPDASRYPDPAGPVAGGADA